LGITVPLVLLLIPNNALAWNWSQPFSLDFHHWLGSFDNGQSYQGGIGCGAYCQGERDAQYDHQNNLVYNPYPQCCHSEFYQHAFHQGYDDRWNSFQSQESSQGTSINVENSPGAYVVSNQYSNQQQNPLQQLAHTVCRFINCNQQQYSQPSWSSPSCQECLNTNNINGDCENGCPWGKSP
jgi:hypothetical protein